MENKTVILAFTGKGGVGKTSISALSARILKEKYKDKKILAIDADPAIGLSTALGVNVSSTVDDVRKLFIKLVNEGETKAAVEMLGEAKYQLSDVLVDVNGISFLAIGRPESAGCYCKVNAYLKEVISLIASNFDYVVIDGEAGIEQVNRRVMEKVTHLILVSDASKKGLNVAKTVKDVANELVMYQECGLIINRISDMNLIENIDTLDMNVLSYISDDKKMTISDMMGNTVFDLDDNSKIYQGVYEALEKLNVI